VSGWLAEFVLIRNVFPELCNEPDSVRAEKAEELEEELAAR
jgi:hypothetical protein